MANNNMNFAVDLIPSETNTYNLGNANYKWIINGVTNPALTDTTYSFSGGTNKITVTPSNGTAQDITITPSITNNITGSGTSGYLAKFNGSNTLTSGPELGNSTTTFLRNDGTWAVPTDTVTTATTSGSGNAVTAISANNGVLTITKETTFLTSHQTIKQDGVTGATVNRFGTCSNSASTAAKTVSITSGTFSLEAGARITVKFSNANTAGTPTLNVNSQGAKNIFHRGTQITTGDNKALLAGTVDFIYDGTQWHLVGNYYDTTYSSQTAANGGTTLSLVTTGEKYTWNNKTSNTGTITSIAPGNGLLNGTGTSAITTSGTLNLSYGTSTQKIGTAAAGSANTVSRSDHVHAIDLATGDSNGQVKVAGTNISVKGLANAAYKAVDTSIDSNSSSTNLPTSAAVASLVSSAFAANDAMIFKGTIAGGNTGNYGALTAAANRGDTYKVSTAGKINGIAVEIGDILICTTDSTVAATSSNYSTIASNWTIVQNNVDGAIFKGTNTFIDGQILVADGTTGKIKTSGLYPPTEAGTNGQYLKSNGSNAPTWETIVAAQIIRW